MKRNSTTSPRIRAAERIAEISIALCTFLAGVALAVGVLAATGHLP